MDYYKIKVFVDNIIKLVREQYNPDNTNDFTNHDIYMHLPYDLYQIIEDEVELRLDYMLRETKLIVKQELKEQLKQASDPNYNNEM